MELVSTQVSDGTESSPERAIELFLASHPAQRHLDLLTEILTQSSNIDERVAALIHGAWYHVCRNNLWCPRFGSLDEYRQSIDYSSVVKPILQRHKKSDRAKQLSSQIILRQWNVHYTVAIPETFRPIFWSKHLLTLMGALSKAKPLPEALDLLQKSVKARPHRGRSRPQLVPSDVQRVLDRLKATKSLHQGYKGRFLRKQSTGPLTALDCDLVRSDSLNSPFVAASFFDSMKNLIPGPENQIGEHSDVKINACGCAPICLPLITLLSDNGSELSRPLVTSLLHWARSVSWESLCEDHLKELYLHMALVQPHGMDRREIVRHLEMFCSSRRSSSSSSDSSTKDQLMSLLPPIAEMADDHLLFSRYTAMPSLWSTWQKEGVVHIAGFFDYLEQYGIFDRVRNTLKRHASGDEFQLISQKCYELICQMIQQDPAYYSLIVACRPDKNWRLIHRPGHYHREGPPCAEERLDFDFALGQTDPLSTVKGTSDIRSTIMLPTFPPEHVLNVVPGSHQPAAESNLATQSCGTKCITMHSGDLVLTMPNLTRHPGSFMSPALLNITQSGVDDNFETLENGYGGTWARLAMIQNYKELGMQYLGPLERSYAPSHFQGYAGDDSRLESASALGEALMGRREWKDRKVIHQRNMALGSDDAIALGFVKKVRDRLAVEFHETLDLIELCHEGSAASTAIDLSTLQTPQLYDCPSMHTGIVPDIDFNLLDFSWIPDPVYGMQLDAGLGKAMDPTAAFYTPEAIDHAGDLMYQILGE
ncbi:hypothetical protein BO70DRAFT_320149 [Aspergillus heteromorphus CBS 117.55]|uniref:Uncharacterized protein n=1 Tax=Aspergillus heteromorphus CBS 117.55 TaxID=1448321 RepID=A0A317VI85_9EURO|nr:uncharacterized protein BO70DRAFT_320149 [Aspergillus heteromorphus CBS 117.55]PWY72887.1 hypothetical protein BO70DRAFT_320149 [Aspergillus heteromorphus CBS 117.55]